MEPEGERCGLFRRDLFGEGGNPMKSLSAQQINGTWATVLLPIAHDESIDWSRMANEIDALVLSGVDGIYTNGTAGEFYAQSEEEFDRMHEMLAEKCENAKMPFQIGASHPIAQTLLSRVRRATHWKPGAIQVTLPDWYPVNEREVHKFLLKVAEVAAPIGLVLYNPPHAKRVVSPEELGRLANTIPSLVGVKVAAGDAAWYKAMRENVPELSIFVPGHCLASGMLNGARGAYSDIACLNPRGAKRWNNLMHTSPKEALEMERRIQSFLADYVDPFQSNRGVSNQAVDKLLAGIGGWANIGLRLRWPYEWIEEEEALRLRPIARQMIPELFQD
jgi:4-hydroxy-tetrahydrodipicolinate synthase